MIWRQLLIFPRRIKKKTIWSKFFLDEIEWKSCILTIWNSIYLISYKFNFFKIIHFIYLFIKNPTQENIHNLMDINFKHLMNYNKNSCLNLYRLFKGYFYKNEANKKNKKISYFQVIFFLQKQTYSTLHNFYWVRLILLK